MIDILKLRFRKNSFALSQLLNLSRKGQLDAEGYLKLATAFESLGGDLYKLRKSLSAGDVFLSQSEDWMAGVSQEILTLQRDDGAKKFHFFSFYRGYRLQWRKHFSLFLFTLSFFLASIVAGWALVQSNPGMASVFLDQALMEAILDKKAWFQDISTPLLTGYQIATHNMKVAFLCFLFAGLLGFGGLAYMVFNGLFFGAIMAYCAVNGFDDALGSFVIAHGVLELTLIVCSTFSGLVFGRVFFLRPISLFKQRFKIAFSDSLTLISGVLPWFVICGFVESTVSPQADISFGVRWGVGLLISVAFWVSTFWPLSLDQEFVTKELSKS